MTLGAALTTPGAGSSVNAAACNMVTMPFAGLDGAALTPTTYRSSDPSPVSYVRWRGVAPSFDGMPLSVDVTVPCGPARRRPTVVMAHGFTDDKTVWEETDRSGTVHSTQRASNDRWNNVWFASRGYSVLNYTARGWRDSCGPDTPGWVGSTPPPQCAPFQYWIHLDDARWEVRDAQWLTGGLVQSGIADRHRLAITGGSYGGAPTAMAALLAGNVVCGAASTPAKLGPDPCAGKSDGDLAPWRTPNGRSRLNWAAALPLYTFADLLAVIAPNGRASDGSALAPPNGNDARPFGVPLAGTVSGLLLAAQVYGSLAPAGSDPATDIRQSTARLLAGNPFPADEPAVRAGVRWARQRSPIAIRPHGRVPIFWVGGMTDALFPALQPLTMQQQLRRSDPSYPFKLFLGDIGHDYAAERADEWAWVKRRMNTFLDHYLRPDRTPAPPRFDVSATVTRCLDHNAPLAVEHGPTWDDLHPRHVTFRAAADQRTSTTTPGPNGAATDPISTATLPGPNSYKGCRIVRPARVDTTVATYDFPLRRDVVLMGGPIVNTTFSSTGPGVPLSVRVWDVAADGSEQGLVTRGTYRTGPAGEHLRARFQIGVQGYRFPANHRIRVEVTANDSPYLQPSSVPADVTVHSLTITLPVR